MPLDDILYSTTGSVACPSLIIYLPTSGDTGSLAAIEAQTVLFERRLFGKETKIVF